MTRRGRIAVAIFCAVAGGIVAIYLGFSYLCQFVCAREPMMLTETSIAAGTAIGVLAIVASAFVRIVISRRARQLMTLFPHGSVWLARRDLNLLKIAWFATALVVDSEGIHSYNYIRGTRVSSIDWARVGQITTLTSASWNDVAPPYQLAIEIDGDVVAYSIYPTSRSAGMQYMDEYDLRKVIASLESHRPRATA
jgi:hypothetical protein